ncbi:MAG: response regulator, partial [Candidatus Eremiobacteraeota bacterium]|nr:response regulator [Candidatus Eremiobacteraeota bacterium]
MGQSPRVLVAGADESVRKALDVCFPELEMDRFETGRTAMNALLKTHYDLVVLDHRLKKPDGVKLLEYLANHPRLREAHVIYCLGKHVDAALPRRLVTDLGVTSLIYHPVEPEELCFQMARLLGLPSPVALPRLTMDTRRTTSRGDSEGGLLLAVGLSEDMVADLIPRATARRLRTAVAEDWQNLTAAEWIEDPPQLLLVDLSGPERKQRLGLFQRIHELELNTQVIALVGEELQDRVEASNRGAARVLTKPFTIEAVIDAVYDVLESNKEEQLKILVVDDDPLTLANLQWLLTQTGYRVQALGQPLAFWETLESFVPDMVILDVIMPAVSGLDLCRAVRTDLRWRDLPLLFLTIQSDAVTAHNLFQAGADDFLTKPLHSLEVLTRVTNRLSRARTARSADRDGLTGVLTRRRAAPTLRRLLRMADRRDIPFSLCVLDLDNFKQVNDQHGHPAGDQVLAALGKLLHRAFRNEDVVARWGGEEFVVGLYGMPSGT